MFVHARDGAPLAYSAHGNGPPVILLHGLGDDRSLWSPIVDRLASDYTCVAIDFRGHGESSRQGDFDPFALAEDIVEMAGVLGLGSPMLVGHSLGGFVATAAAQCLRARAVVNVDQQLNLDALASFVRERGDALRSGSHEAVMIEILQLVGIHQLPPPLQQALLDRRRRLPREVVLGVWRRLLECSDDELATLVRERLRVEGIPYCALHGSEPGPEYQTWLRGLILGADVVVREGAGHYPHLVDADGFAALVRTIADTHGDEVGC